MALLKRGIPVVLIAVLLVSLSFAFYNGFSGRFDFMAVRLPNGRSEIKDSVVDTVKDALRKATVEKDGSGLDLQYPDLMFSTYRADGTEIWYALYVPSMIQRVGYVYHIEDEKLYRLATTDFSELLSLDIFAGAYRYDDPPALFLMSDSGMAQATATAVDWSYILANGQSQRVTESDTSDTVHAVPSSRNTMNLAFDYPPDTVSVRILRDGVVVYENTSSSTQVPCPTVSGQYRYEVSAMWNISVEKDYYGSASYVCDLDLQTPVTVQPETDAVEQGAFLRVFATATEDAAPMTVSCPQLSYNGFFYDNLDGKVALIAIPYDAEPGPYTFTVSTDGFDSSYAFEVVEKEFASGKLNISSSVNRNDTTEQDQYLTPLRSLQSEETYMTNGAFAEPLKVNYRISTPFGQFRYTNDNATPTRHNGVDMAAGGSKPDVYAAGAGKVIFVMEMQITGKTVVIDHGMNVHTHYYHLDKVNVEVGDIVEREQKIGVMGSTGYSTGNHLHFTAMLNGVEIDPYLLFETNLMENR